MAQNDLTVAKALAEAREKLAEAGIDDPAPEARSLLRSVTGLSQTELLTQPDRPLSENEVEAMTRVVARRASHEPLQYITGTVEFHGREFAVDERVLIPRPETEHLVEQALAFARERKLANPRILDIGTGS